MSERTDKNKEEIAGDASALCNLICSARAILDLASNADYDEEAIEGARFIVGQAAEMASQIEVDVRNIGRAP